MSCWEHCTSRASRTIFYIWSKEPLLETGCGFAWNFYPRQNRKNVCTWVNWNKRKINISFIYALWSDMTWSRTFDQLLRFPYFDHRRGFWGAMLPKRGFHHSYPTVISAWNDVITNYALFWTDSKAAKWFWVARVGTPSLFATIAHQNPEGC